MESTKVQQAPTPEQMTDSNTRDIPRGWLVQFILAILVPPQLKRFYRAFRSTRFRMLDVGCGLNAPTKNQRYFPLCEYHGLDVDDKGLSEIDRKYMTRFYKADLDEDSLTQIPDMYFDVIVMSHVIEHLHNGLEAVRVLTQKLKPGGYLYVEFPGVRSLNVPSARSGFLHFHDDSTHVKLYTIPEIVNVLLDNSCVILKAGVRRDPVRLLMTPFLFARGLFLRRDPWSGRLWDAFGIAEFVYARKRQ